MKPVPPQKYHPQISRNPPNWKWPPWLTSRQPRSPCHQISLSLSSALFFPLSPAVHPATRADLWHPPLGLRGPAHRGRGGVNRPSWPGRARQEMLIGNTLLFSRFCVVTVSEPEVLFGTKWSLPTSLLLGGDGGPWASLRPNSLPWLPLGSLAEDSSQERWVG